MPNPRNSARSVWSKHAGTQKLTITRQDTFALTSAFASPSRQEVPPPPAHWLKNAGSGRGEPISDQQSGVAESCFLSCGDDALRRRYDGSTCSDSSDNMSEISDSGESACEGYGVAVNFDNLFRLDGDSPL
jgi:hypothetical protein